MKSFYAIVLFGMLAAVIATFLLPVSSVESNRQATVMVTSIFGGGGGVLLDERTVLTARHIVDKAQSNKTPLVVYDIDKNAYTVKVEDIKISSFTDLAVLTLSKPMENVPFVSYRCNMPATGESLYSIGMTDKWPWTYLRGYVALNDITPKTYGLFESQANSLESPPFDQFMMDLPLYSGQSGGGVFDNRGLLIGIVSSVFRRDSIDSPMIRETTSLSFAVSAVQICKVLGVR